VIVEPTEEVIIEEPTEEIIIEEPTEEVIVEEPTEEVVVDENTEVEVISGEGYDYIVGGCGWNGNAGTSWNDGTRDNYFSDSYYDIPSGKEIGSYFATWGVYGRNYGPEQMPVERMTHVYVAFGGICGDNPGAYKSGSALETACSDLHSGSDTASYWVPGIKS